MPLTQEQEHVEHEWRVEQMVVTVEQARTNTLKLQQDIEQSRASVVKMQLDMEQSRLDVRRQGRRDFVTILGTLVAAFAAGAAWVKFLH